MEGSLQFTRHLEKRIPWRGAYMKIIFFNCHGLMSPSKKSSLKRRIDVLAPNVLLIQETMGTSDVVVGVVKSMLPGWEFVAIDANGRLGGLASGWRLKV